MRYPLPSARWRVRINERYEYVTDGLYPADASAAAVAQWRRDEDVDHAERTNRIWAVEVKRMDKIKE